MSDSNVISSLKIKSPVNFRPKTQKYEGATHEDAVKLPWKNVTII